MTFQNFKGSLHGKEASFNISNVDSSLVSSLRRIIISEIPNVAFDFDVNNSSKDQTDIIVNKNTSALHNEFLIHRISLLPLCFNIEDIQNFEPDRYKFILKKKNTTSEIMHVTTNDFEIYDENNKKYPDEFTNMIFPKNEFSNGYILITKLKPNLYDISNGEEVDIVCTASKNIGKYHTRWSPVSKCVSIYVTDHEAAELSLQEKFKKFELDNAKTISEQEKSDIRKKFNSLEIDRNNYKNEYGEPSVFELNIQSECRMHTKYLVKTALEIMRDKIQNFIEKLEKNEYIINLLTISDNYFEFNIQNEDDTLLNMLQSYIYNFNIRQSQGIIDSVNYYQPHPLHHKMILKIKFSEHKKKLDNDFAIDFIVKNSKKMIDLINGYILEWATATENVK